jgi:outer membrane lipoprotein SlyB
MRIHPLIAGAAASVIVLSGVGVAAITGVLPGTHAEKQVAKACTDCGVVIAVKEVQDQGRGTGLGAVVGGVAGAVVGHEIADGKNVGTVVGAAGGAIAGHQIERHARSTRHYDVDVRMADGSTKSLRLNSKPAWKAGDPVRLQGGKLLALAKPA